MPIDVPMLDWLDRTFSGPDLAKIDAERTQNALGRLKLQQAQPIQAAQANPNTTPEQFARMGAPEIGNAIESAQTADQQRQSGARSLFAQMMTSIAQSPTPKADAAQLV